MQTVEPESYHRQILRSLLCWEYLAHRTMLARFLAAWLILVVILPVIGTARSLTLFGLVLAVRLGTGLGGADVIGGYEETVFTSPASALWRYLLRSLAGLALMLVLLLGAAVVISAHLPQSAWGLIVDSGLTARPEATAWSRWWTVVACCSALYTMTFAIAAATTNASVARSASIAAGGVLVALAIAVHLCFGRWYPDLAAPASYTIAILACTLAGLLALPIGYLAYRRKQVSIQPPTQASLIWVVLVILIIGVFLVLGTCA
jgi:hypothetical protein